MAELFSALKDFQEAVFPENWSNKIEKNIWNANFIWDDKSKA